MGGIEYTVKFKYNDKVIAESNYFTIFGSYFKALKMIWWTLKQLWNRREQLANPPEKSRWDTVVIERHQLG